MKIQSKNSIVTPESDLKRPKGPVSPASEKALSAGWRSVSAKPKEIAAMAPSSLASALSGLNYQEAFDPAYLMSRTTPEELAATRTVLANEPSDTRGVFLASKLFEGAARNPQEFTIALVGAGHLPALTQAAGSLGIAHFVTGTGTKSSDVGTNWPAEFYSFGVIRNEQHPAGPTNDAQVPAALFIGEMHGSQTTFSLPPVATLLKAGVKKVRVGVENETGELSLNKLAMSASNKAAIASQLAIYEKAGIAIQVFGLDSPLTPPPLPMTGRVFRRARSIDASLRRTAGKRRSRLVTQALRGSPNAFSSFSLWGQIMQMKQRELPRRWLRCEPSSAPNPEVRVC
jgi:hypothetical protein